MVQMWNEILEQPLVLDRCAETNKECMRSLVKAIEEKDINSVVIAARGTSDHAAVYGKYAIELLTGIPVSLAATSVFTMYKGGLKLKNALVIGISQSGQAADVIEVIRSANADGALTVAITNFSDSPLANEARFHLFCDAGLEKSVAATKTFTAELYLIAQLAAEWAKNESLKEDLKKVPEKLLQTFETAGHIRDKVERYRFMEECFVLARGMNYAIALEAALKIQETTYVRAKAFATSDFHHGPFAMIEKGMPAFVYAPSGPSMKDAGEMIHKLKQAEVEIIVISNNKELLDLGDCSFSIPETDNDFVSPFMNVVVAQMFACQLALTRGLNPDSPRGLKKVTITR